MVMLASTLIWKDIIKVFGKILNVKLKLKTLDKY